MKKIFATFLMIGAVTFFGLIGYAGLEPREFARSAVLLDVFRLSGAVVFIGIIYSVVKLVSAGIRSGSSTARGAGGAEKQAHSEDSPPDPNRQKRNE